ncbi:MAG: hypothetical protein NC125_03630 [Muribaculaceae bacterium]|nr:hypothetical protein [Muribaculaceae bacterium]
MKKEQNVPGINAQAKDHFFAKVFESEESKKRLVSFLSGRSVTDVQVADVRPVIFGRKENDLGILADHVIYYMIEAQASPNPNIPYRLLEYITAGLRGLIGSEDMLYRNKMVELAVPKLYVVFTGVKNRSRMPEETERIMRLSDSYMACDTEPDLELTVHAYEFVMSREETCDYLEENRIPGRFEKYRDEELFWYALTANSLTYILQAGHDSTYKRPGGLETAADVCRLLKERGIFRELFEKKEVCDMTVATFSREEMFRYAGIEEGMERGMERGLEEGLERGKYLTKRIFKLEQQGCDIDTIAEKVGISREEVIEILQ